MPRTRLTRKRSYLDPIWFYIYGYILTDVLLSRLRKKNTKDKNHG